MRLEEYINTFYEGEARDAVVTQVMKSRVVKQAMDTPQGKALLNNVIDRIRDKLMSIVGSCAEKSKEKQTESVRNDAAEIHIMFNLIKDWAQIIVDGEKHEEQIALK
jgi:hypothetical protein